MRILIEIFQAIIALFGRKRRPKAMEPATSFYVEEIPPEPQYTYQSLGIDKDGVEQFINEDFSEEELVHAREQFRIDNINKNIRCKETEVSIDWEDTVLWSDERGLECKSTQYKTVSGDRRPSIDKIVVHWDGCLSSNQCAKVLRDRGLSAHFCIDNDGTIYQLMDTNHVAWHARGVNSKSIGIEISNAVYMKHARRYRPARPRIKESMLHGKTFQEHLGFYDVQVAALKELIKALCSFYNIPLEYPNQDGELIRNAIKTSSFTGVICHYHVTKNKVDPACLDLAKLIEEIKNEA